MFTLDINTTVSTWLDTIWNTSNPMGVHNSTITLPKPSFEHLSFIKRRRRPPFNDCHMYLYYNYLNSKKATQQKQDRGPAWLSMFAHYLWMSISIPAFKETVNLSSYIVMRSMYSRTIFSSYSVSFTLWEERNVSISFIRFFRPSILAFSTRTDCLCSRRSSIVLIQL